MERQAGVQIYILDLECGSRIPSGDLNATLVTSEEECTFSGEMTVPGKSTFRLPFDDKHWYCIRHKEICLTVSDASTSTNGTLWTGDDKHAHHAQFRFQDTGEGERWFRIFVRHSGLLVTHHSDFNWNLVQHYQVDPNDHNREWQYWTFEEAGNGTYFIKSKKDEKVIYLSDVTGTSIISGSVWGNISYTMKQLKHLKLKTADLRRTTDCQSEKFTFEKMDRI